jgi:hypothetical protein
MTVNKIQLTLPRDQDRVIQVPVMLNWELLDTENEITEIENQITAEVAGQPIDFETNRFSHSGHTRPIERSVNENPVAIPGSPDFITDILYEFYFFSGGTLDGTTSVNNWVPDYRAAGFNTDEIYYFSNGFRNSFFKLDFYSSPVESNQTNYLTVILPTTQGERMPVVMQGLDVTIKKPRYRLDWVGDKKGYFIYWVKTRTYVDIDTFYMSCKFWDAKTGTFIRMINRPQALQNINTYSPNQVFNFYYQVRLDYPTQTYTVYDTISFDRVGTSVPIKWYEYIDP